LLKNRIKAGGECPLEQESEEATRKDEDRMQGMLSSKKEGGTLKIPHSVFARRRIHHASLHDIKWHGDQSGYGTLTQKTQTSFVRILWHNTKHEK
jgi:hypothetical protein